MTPTIDIADIKMRLYDRLKASGWHNKLKGFLLSSDFDTIIEYLVDQVGKGNRFTPPLRYLLRAFEQCPYNMLKAVIVGDYPYARMGVCDGIALSCSLTQKEEPPLKEMFDALDQLKEGEYSRDPDLKRWSRQGLLLINTTFTCQMDKPTSHAYIWQPFISYLFDMLNFENRGLIFVFMGAKAGELAQLIGDQHYKIHITHPSEALFQGKPWDHKNIFSKIDQIAKENYQTAIEW